MVVSCWGNWIKSESNFKGWLTAGGRERVSEFNVLSWTIRQRWNLCARIGNSLSRFSIDFATQHYMTLYRWRTNEAPDSDYISIWIRACVKGKGRKGWTWRSCCPCFVKLHQRGFSFLITSHFEYISPPTPQIFLAVQRETSHNSLDVFFTLRFFCWPFGLQWKYWFLFSLDFNPFACHLRVFFVIVENMI